MTFPDLPALGELVLDDPWWTYRTSGIGGGSGVVRLRVWRSLESRHEIVAVATELGAGVSVTNSIEFIAAKLATAFPRQHFVLFEHWPDGESGAEHLEQVVATPGEQPRWRRVWPTPPTNPLCDQFGEWIRQNGPKVLTSIGDAR